MVLARVQSDFGSCWVGATHLPRRLATDRKQAADRLLDVLARVQAPWIVCGDFNHPADTWLPTGNVTAPRLALPTYPTDGPTEAIDYCIASGLTVEATVLTSGSSDHLPVVFEADLGDG